MTNTHALELSHNEALQLLPWHVQGSLATDEAAQVSAHLDDCDECRREAQELRGVFSVAQPAGCDVDEQRLDALFERIDEHEAAHGIGNDATTQSLADRLQRHLSAWWSPRWALPIGGVAAAALALVLWLPQPVSPTGDYEVHSGAETTSPTLRITFNAPPQPNGTDLFGQHALIVNATPESSTQYVVRVRPDLSVADLSTLIRDLEDRPDVATVNIASER